MVAIGQRIKELRVKTGISQQKLADTLGVSRPTITQIEAGERKVSSDELIKLSEIFDCTLEHLLGLKGEPEVILHEQKKAPERSREPEMRINVPQKNLDKFRRYSFISSIKLARSRILVRR